MLNFMILSEYIYKFFMYNVPSIVYLKFYNASCFNNFDILLYCYIVMCGICSCSSIQDLFA